MTIERISYHGWPDCLLLSNGVVEVIVVPAIGRVMQFRFAGEKEGAFWENRELDGQIPGLDAATDQWLNFGGDKSWPAPQSDWETHIGRAWPPPTTFDSRPYQAVVSNEHVALASDLDPHYGVRLVRQLRLVGRCPQLEITTQFRKEQGAAVKIGDWVVTQLPEPERVFVLLPENTEFANGYQQQRGPCPKDVRRDGRLLSLKRDPREYIKIETQGTSMLWMNQELALLIRAGKASDQHPDVGTRTEIYTNPDPYPYVELETVGPITHLEIGNEIVATNTYTLYRRSTDDCTREARRVLEL